MSRMDRRLIEVAVDASGAPLGFRIAEEPMEVFGILCHWREWVGILDGEPERDVWRVDTTRGVCELHHLRYPTDESLEPDEGDWLLWRWED